MAELVNKVPLTPGTPLLPLTSFVPPVTLIKSFVALNKLMNKKVKTMSTTLTLNVFVTLSRRNAGVTGGGVDTTLANRARFAIKSIKATNNTLTAIVFGIPPQIRLTTTKKFKVVTTGGNEATLLSTINAVLCLMTTLESRRVTNVKNVLTLVMTFRPRSAGTVPTTYLCTPNKSKRTNKYFDKNIVFNVARYVQFTFSIILQAKKVPKFTFGVNVIGSSVQTFTTK